MSQFSLVEPMWRLKVLILLARSPIFIVRGVAMIGMTNMPEAKLAREAGMCYSSLAMVTDYDFGIQILTVDQVIATLKSNSDKSKSIVVTLSQSMTCARVRVRVQRLTRTQKSSRACARS